MAFLLTKLPFSDQLPSFIDTLQIVASEMGGNGMRVMRQIYKYASHIGFNQHAHYIYLIKLKLRFYKWSGNKSDLMETLECFNKGS